MELCYLCFALAKSRPMPHTAFSRNVGLHVEIIVGTLGGLLMLFTSTQLMHIAYMLY